MRPEVGAVSGPDDADTWSAGDGPVRKLLRLLELVRTTPLGSVVYREATTLLEQLEQDCLRAERSYAALCTLLLDRHLSASADAAVVAELQVLRRQLQAPLSEADGERLHGRLQQLLSTQAPSASADAAAVPPFEEAGDDNPAPRTPAHLRQLQDSVAQEIRETLAQNQEFGVTLDLVLSELGRVGDAARVQQVKNLLLQQVRRLHAGHLALARRLETADRYLNMLALGSRRLTQELSRARELSLTDELTGLANRRAFLQHLGEEVARVERYGTALAVAMIDLDGFKAVNDRYGHGVGDQILCCYATRIFRVFRQYDLVARYGGEEFAVLLPNTDRAGVVAALGKARKRAAEARCSGLPADVRVPSFSAGVALCRRGETVSDLVRRADEALYRAKRMGRDRVELDAAVEH